LSTKFEKTNDDVLRIKNESQIDKTLHRSSKSRNSQSVKLAWPLTAF